MNSKTSNTPAVKKQPIRDENGRFASYVTTPATQVRQAQVDTSEAHKRWLRLHGLSAYDPSELFAGTGKQ